MSTDPTGTLSTYRCGSCAHNALEHGGEPRRCMNGSCPCLASREHVESAGEAVEIPTWAGYDHAAGRWAL